MPTDGDPIREGGGRQITLEAVHSTVVVVAVVAMVGTVVEAPQTGAICQWEMFQCNTHTQSETRCPSQNARMASTLGGWGRRWRTEDKIDEGNWAGRTTSK